MNQNYSKTVRTFRLRTDKKHKWI